MVHLLASRGADLNAIAHFGRRPLHFCTPEHLETALTLIRLVGQAAGGMGGFA